MRPQKSGSELTRRWRRLDPRHRPAIIESLAVGAWILGTGGGVVQPHSLMLAAIAAI
jgi:hypothetical protein